MVWSGPTTGAPGTPPKVIFPFHALIRIFFCMFVTDSCPKIAHIVTFSASFGMQKFWSSVLCSAKNSPECAAYTARMGVSWASSSLKQTLGGYVFFALVGCQSGPRNGRKFVENGLLNFNFGSMVEFYNLRFHWFYRLQFSIPGLIPCQGDC